MFSTKPSGIIILKCSEDPVHGDVV